MRKRSPAVISTEDDLVYVLIDKREVFDAINLPVSDGQCLSKSIQHPGEPWVIFQYWGERT